MAASKTSKSGSKKTGSNRKGVTAAKKRPETKSANSDKAVTVDRRSNRERRKTSDRRQKSVPVAVERRTFERRAKVSRRRQIDPTTCERDYSAEEIEFMNAMDEYKRTSGRMFPTCSEILEVLMKLGYVKNPSIGAVSSGPAGQPGNPTDEANIRGGPESGLA